jgi:ethanolamine ammonia-lyase small subunit
LADHAVALDAVFKDVSDDVLSKFDICSVQSSAKDKEEFLKNPEKGNKLSEEAVKELEKNIDKNSQVQIIICDGLSSTAIESNLADILPPVTEGLKAAGIKTSKPLFIKNGRVRIMDNVGEVLAPEVVLEFIGERPGLGTVESMSAYVCYKPNYNTVEAERTMISNIHKNGTPPAEAGAQLVDLIKKVLQHKASGIKLNEKMK